MLSAVQYIVSTERLGWPPKRRGVARLVPWETQTGMRYPVDPDVPTATCHLQQSEQRVALCGYEWEGLVAVPGEPTWDDIAPELRCDVCQRRRTDD